MLTRKDKKFGVSISQSTAYTTTDVLAHPELAKKCSVPFKPANRDRRRCQLRSYLISLAEF
ncbi:hypothetical protein OK016_30200 [Vibrio chagasii]|nr:hypothetical protein [Vibrio chagasii]